MTTAYLLLGTNLGNRGQNLAEGRHLIADSIGRIEAASLVYETEPWGYNDQPWFLNQALEVTTSLSPQETINGIARIEEKIGKTFKADPNGPRVIDVDLLLFGGVIMSEPHLTIPHPRLHLRNFTLVPLKEIAPAVVHPILKMSIAQLEEKCLDELTVNHHRTHAV